MACKSASRWPLLSFVHPVGSKMVTTEVIEEGEEGEEVDASLLVISIEGWVVTAKIGCDRSANSRGR